MADWLHTTWEGTRHPPFFTSHFAHRARARKLADGTIEAEYFDDETRIPGAGGKVWRRIVRPQLAERLYRQAAGETEPKPEAPSKGLPGVCDV